MLEIEHFLDMVLNILDPVAQGGCNGMEVLHNNVPLLDHLLVGNILHKLKQSVLPRAVHHCVFGLRYLLVELFVFGTLLEDIVKHTGIKDVISLITQHVDDRYHHYACK